MKWALVFISIVSFAFASDISKMLQRQIEGTNKWHSDNVSKIDNKKPQENPPKKIQKNPASIKADGKNWHLHKDFQAYQTGDEKIDKLIASLGISVIYDIPHNESRFDGLWAVTAYEDGENMKDFTQKTIRMKQKSYFSSRYSYVFVLLHEIGHAIGSLQYNRNLAKYDATLKNYQYKIEESIADKYAIAMCEYLGYKGNTIAIEKRISGYYNDLKQQGGDLYYQYIDTQVNNSIEFSKVLMGD